MSTIWIIRISIISMIVGSVGGIGWFVIYCKTPTGTLERNKYKNKTAPWKALTLIGYACLMLLMMYDMFIKEDEKKESTYNYSSYGSSGYSSTGSSGNTKTKSNNDGYKDFLNGVDKAGNGNGKATWDDWNRYAEKNGYNKAY